MIFEDYSNFDGIALANLVRRGEVSPKDLVDSALEVVERQNPAINCVVQKLPKGAGYLHNEHRTRRNDVWTHSLQEFLRHTF